MNKFIYIYLTLFSITLNAGKDEHKPANSEIYKRTPFQDTISTISIKLRSLGSEFFNTNIASADKEKIRLLGRQCREIAKIRASRKVATQEEQIIIDDALQWLEYHKVKTKNNTPWTQLEM